MFTDALRFVGQVMEIKGSEHQPFIQWCFSLCGYGPETPDETPWCSAFVNELAWRLRLPRSKSAAARSWLNVGRPISLSEARAENDVVVFKRGGAGQPGPEVTKGAPGHVAVFAGFEAPWENVQVIGGNQADGVTVASFPVDRVLGVRRLD